MDIQGSFNESLIGPNIIDSSLDIAELSIDTITNNALINNLPVVKIIAGLIQTGANIHDRLFLKKILALLQGIEDTSEEDRRKIISDIDSSNKYQIKVGEKLLYILDTCDDHINAKNVSKLFVAMLKKQISYAQYVEAAQIMARLTQTDLEEFLAAYGLYYIDDSAASLGHTGLIYTSTSDVEVEVDLKKIEQDDWDDPAEHYEADTSTSGGDIVIEPTSGGRTVFEVFGIGEAALRKQWEEAKQRQKENIVNSSKSKNTEGNK